MRANKQGDAKHNHLSVLWVGTEEAREGARDVGIRSEALTSAEWGWEVPEKNNM